MAWRWKSTVSHTNIIDLLKFVKDFIGGCSSIVTDNCCSDRTIIQEILGGRNSSPLGSLPCNTKVWYVIYSTFFC